jgi:hypothetical protein
VQRGQQSRHRASQPLASFFRAGQNGLSIPPAPAPDSISSPPSWTLSDLAQRPRPGCRSRLDMEERTLRLAKSEGCSCCL